MARTGRPREFDRDKALEAALTLFWTQGYEPTSLNQLKASMGNISPASFYAAFGSKEALFREVVQRYLETYGQVMAPLWDETLAPRDAIEQTLRRSARMQTTRSHPTGCLIVLGAANCSPENQPVQTLLAAERERNRKGIKACVDRAIANGELTGSSATETLPTLLTTFLHGMASETRDGDSAKKLDAAITTLMQVWDSLASKH
ncbi:TetR/AcrR family transcriptional regulator [Novacetimonas hansenii]|uniref:TetR family transcriptional regulator n=2 Tax=Novacetimonas hansenii TaxID=436 RepID=A0ABQ0SH75_NOVHA|nr:TetR/AcrR family transcriptional regulator [Novacetimonas hansenii]EFG85384.1 transcriptional regulator TetR [Novacetimonas hansenii ATCC 23769]GAN85094.1 transcriptional regulator TetR [Novacetimonas hansenii JCM 7643]GBQ60033.1 TetR family transcriptional regulator [Novacetimonas hansenii NRIC 0243]GEC64482.1 TetR family transcriptional regulator [Novacetimonas hansenii]